MFYNQALRKLIMPIFLDKLLIITVGADDYKQAEYYTKKIKITYIGTICISLAQILLLSCILTFV